MLCHKTTKINVPENEAEPNNDFEYAKLATLKFSKQ